MGLLVLALALVTITLAFHAPDTDGTVPRTGADGGTSESRAPAGEDPCIDCHSGDTMPGIIEDWSRSRHAEEDVSCVDCHVGEETDPDVTRHNGYWVSAVVSPADCGECHEDEAAEFQQSLHSLGTLYYEYLYGQGGLPVRESEIEGGYIIRDGKPIDDAATLRGCQACHGTNMTGTGVDDWTVWPNNGIGRINPDESMGSCSACHSRHRFSKAEARRPETCGQCHMGPDHPHIEIYLESKHGNIYSSEGESWDWDSEEWEAGVDYRAPTCAACHMSAAGDLPATHDVGSRLMWELEPPISKRTDNTANSLGVTIGDGSTWQQKEERMKTVCLQCHSETWVDNYFQQADLVIELYNTQYTEAKAIVDALYEDELLTSKAFDEEIEFVLYEMWHHEGRRARAGAWMMGPDYTQWHGFYEVFNDRVTIENIDAELRAQAAEGEHEDDDEDDGGADDWVAWSIPIMLLLGFIILALAMRRKG